MNWVKASRIYELSKLSDDYIRVLNKMASSLKYTKISNSDIEIFCDIFPNLEIYDFSVNSSFINCITISFPSLDLCMTDLDIRLKNETGKFYILSIYKEPNDIISIKLLKINELD